MTDPLLMLAQWTSPAYPMGSFTYSHGLESLVDAGLVSDEDTLSGWIKTVLEHGAGGSDALLIAAGYGATFADEVEALDKIALAFCGSAERRLECSAQGTAFAGVTSKVWGKTLNGRSFPVVFGEALSAHNVPLKIGIMYYLQSIASNLSSASIRLGLIGQDAGQSLTARLQSTIEGIAAWAISASIDDLSSTAWVADMAAIQHERLETRVFRT